MSVDFSKYKFRASYLHRIMANPKAKSEVLSEGAKTYLHEIYEDLVFGEKPEVSTNEMEKGKIVEDDAIKLLRKNSQIFYQKYSGEELQNEYITGNPDIIDVNNEVIRDIKCPYHVRTWYRYTEKKALDAYQWQIMSYLWLTGYKQGVIDVCAVPTPDHLILDEANIDFKLKYKQEILSEQELMDLEEKIYNLHNFAVIPEKDRIKHYYLQFDEIMLAKMISKIEAAREYLCGLANSESLALSVQKAKTTSFVAENGENMPIVDKILSKYREFGIELKFDEKVEGASVSQYRFTPLNKGVKIEKAKNYNSDIQSVLKTGNVIIETPIPKTNQIGIQVENEQRKIVKPPKVDKAKNLVLSIGQTMDGKDYQVDLSTAPHILIGGTTGSGKSVLLNNIINQLKQKDQSFEVIDPKSEFENSIKNYEAIYTLLKETKETLNDRIKDKDKSRHNPFVLILDEMETLFADTTQIDYEIDYDKYPPTISLEKFNKNGNMSIKMVKNPEYAEQLKIQRRQPKLGDICREMIEYIIRLGRSEKMHVICATQNPTVQNVSSNIKANCPTRICLHVVTDMNSKVILDTTGGEKLLNHGDMLLMSPNEYGLVRLQGYFKEKNITK